MNSAAQLLHTDTEPAHEAEESARALLAEGRAAEAERLARAAVAALEGNDSPSLLAGALTTHGVALARLGEAEKARRTLERAGEAARRAGDNTRAGHAALALVEELAEHVPERELVQNFERAVELLGPSASPPLMTRLCNCARRVVSLVGERGTKFEWGGFSFREAVHQYEASIIEKALAEAGGSVTRAAYLLGFRHHNSLASILNNRHRELLTERSPIKPRRRSIITKSRKA